MAVGRLLGWCLLFVAGAVLIRDVIIWHDLHAIAPLSLEGMWSDLGFANVTTAPDSAALQDLPLWRRGVELLLSLWAAPVFLIIGLGLVAIRRPNRPRRFR